jgi:putative transposase
VVDRRFEAARPNELWVADITYVPTASGFSSLAGVLDVYSRRVVGRAMETHLRVELVIQALNMAVRQRGGHGAIHHADQGSQYTSLAFGKRCREMGIRLSMESVGDCYDNALCGSFFATLECELLEQVRFAMPREARMGVFEYLEGWYNPHRRHSAWGTCRPQSTRSGP